MKLSRLKTKRSASTKMERVFIGGKEYLVPRHRVRQFKKALGDRKQRIDSSMMRNQWTNNPYGERR